MEFNMSAVYKNKNWGNYWVVKETKHTGDVELVNEKESLVASPFPNDNWEPCPHLAGDVMTGKVFEPSGPTFI